MSDKNVNVTIRHQGGCGRGCGTWLIVMFALGLLIEAWEGSNGLARALEVIVTLAVIVAALIVYGKQQQRKVAETTKQNGDSK